MIYVQCNSCSELTPKYEGYCNQCHTEMDWHKNASDSAPAVYGFKSGWYEHIDINPVYIKGKKQLRDETRRRGLTSEYGET